MPIGGHRGRDLMAVGFTTTYAISAYHHKCCEFESRSSELYSIQHYMIKFVSDFAAGRRFSPGTPVSSTNKTDCHNTLYNLNIVESGIKHHNPTPSKCL